jgi:hypothetical protein
MLWLSSMGRRRVLRLLGLAAIGASVVAAVGCRCDDMFGPSRRIEEASISKCERGIERATKAPTADEAMAIYYRECAFVNAEVSCRNAWLRAADAPPDTRLPTIVDACSKAYCPLLKEHPFEACAPGFKATSAGVFRAWPPLYSAMMQYDAGDQAPRLTRSMLALYANMQQRGAAAPSASASAPSASASGHDAGPLGSSSAMASASAGSPPVTSAGAPAGSASGAKAQPAANKR